MKLILILLATIFLQQGYSANAQTITISKKNISLQNVLKEIRVQTGYDFFFEDASLSNSKKVDLDIKNGTLEEVLESSFRDQPLTYSISGNAIVVKEKKRVPAPLETAVQQKTVQGAVTAENGEPLIGVTVAVKGTTKATTTNVNGLFEIQAKLDDILQFSYIGFTSQEVKVGSQLTLNVTLKEDLASLEDVVVVGYGTQKRENLTGSISIVDGKDLESRPITNASQALQGVQGLYVNQAGGQPGADGATIRIRGIGSMGSASKLGPLVMVDGVEFSLSAVNPNDIESISVLKDAASTAIYGSRAANGVILITTKKGKAGQTSIEYSNYFGSQKATYLPDPVDNSVEFLEAYNTAMVNAGGSKYYSDDLISQFKNNPTSLIYPNTNWMDEMFGSAPIQEHNIRFSGGSEKTRFNLSLGYLDQDGVLLGTSSNKYSANIRVGTQLTDRIHVEGALMGTYQKMNDNVSGISTAMNRLMRMVPIQPIGKLENGDWPDSWVLTPGQNSFENPMFRATEGFRSDKVNNLLGSLSLKYKILEDLNFQTTGAFNYNDLLQEEFSPKISLHDARTGAVTRPWTSIATRTSYYSRSPRLTMFNTLTYNKQIGDKHNITALAGQSFEKYESLWFDAQNQGYASNDLTELNLGSVNQRVRGTSVTSALLSYFGRVQYSLLDKYLVETNFRYDGSSKFSKKNRWGFFPSFSLGWRIEQESFMQNVNWVDALKLRGSWGQIGNQEIGLFQYVNGIAFGNDYAFGGVLAPGAAVTQSKDPNISWETSTITNLGLDFGLFHGKLNGTIEVFNKRTDGILRTVQLPAQVGNLQGPTSNIAVVDNSGFEIGLNHQNRISDQVSYEIGAQLTKIKNKVIDTKGEIIYGTNRITKEGSAIDSWYVYKTDGLFQTQAEIDAYPTYSSRVSPGDIKYVDLDGNGKIDGDDRYIAGNSFPDFTYGFNLGITVKGVQLSTFWQGVSGISVYPDANLASPFNNGAGLEKKWLTDAWTPTHTNATLPKLTARNQYVENFQPSDFWLQDASYLRLKNIQLSYPFTGEALNKIGVKQIRVFANGQNILTFSKFKQFDPERNTLNTNLSEYPSVKMVTVGLNINL